MIYQPSQFSWTIVHDKPVPPEYEVEFRQIAKEVIYGVSSDPTGGATHYHADYVDPWWADHYERTAVIETHIFYK